MDIVEIIAITFLTYTLTKKEETSKKNLVYLLALGRYLLPVAIRYSQLYIETLKSTSNKTSDHDCTLCMDSLFLGVKVVFGGFLYTVS
jgi:hypothetical protein